MSSWCNQYLAALHERDKKEKAAQSIYNHCPYTSSAFHSSVNSGFSDTKLADRTATRDSNIESNASQAPEAAPASNLNPKTDAARLQLQASGHSETVLSIRRDLSEAQRSKGEMQARLQTSTEELQNLKTQSRFNSKRINELTVEKAVLITRIRDRDAELRGKAQLLVVGSLLILGGWQITRGVH